MNTASVSTIVAGPASPAGLLGRGCYAGKVRCVGGKQTVPLVAHGVGAGDQRGRQPIQGYRAQRIG